jgi:uncharacterized protein YraI
VQLQNKSNSSLQRLAGAALAVALVGGVILPQRPTWALPATQQAAEVGVIVAEVRVNLRDGPGANYSILDRLEPGAQVTILGRNDAGEWIRVRVESTGRTGWVAASLLQQSSRPATPSLLPTVTPAAVSITATNDDTTSIVRSTNTTTATTTISIALATEPPTQIEPDVPTAVTRPANMNVRAGPGTHYAVVSTVRAGTALRILAIGPDGDWYQVQLEGRDQAWVFAALTNPSGPLDTLTRISAEQAPPPAPPPPAAGSSSPASASVASTAPPAGAGFFAYGIQAQLWQNSEKPAIASAIRDLGFSWVKQQLRWEFVENSPGAIDWSETDQVVEVMSGNGINVLFSIFTAPQWTRPDKPGTGGPPNDFNLYADFAGKVAARYCGRLGAVEIWNEQNLQREWEGFALDPALYMDLLRRAYTAVKANCPSVIVVSGGPTPTGNSPVAIDDVDYLRGMYAHGLASYSDAIGVHPSGFANPPEVTVDDWQQGRYTAPASHFDHRSFYFRSTMEAYRQVMVANGDLNKRLWPTEFGWGSSSTPFPGYEYQAYITESAQAQYLVRAFGMMRDWGWVGVPFLWNLNFTEGEMSTFRIINRPAYDALRSMTK